MRKRGKILIALGVGLAAFVLTPILYIETGCRPGRGSIAESNAAARLPADEHRPFARTLLTYPEWHIVYSADSLGRHLMAGKPPSAYRYGDDIKGFWTSYCAVNHAVGQDSAAGDAKVMTYTIGLSFTAEMLVKSFWENTIGSLAEWLGGWHSPDDRYAARIQQNYGAFMHQTPWYRYPFGVAFDKLWTLGSEGHGVRHLERQVALSAEYGVKAGYAKLIGAASGATLGRDKLTLRYIASAPDDAVAIVAPARLVGHAGQDVVVEAPRYEIFSTMLETLATRPVTLQDIAGNDRIFLTILQRQEARPLTGSLLSMPLGDRPGWKRVGLVVAVPDLLSTIRTVKAEGGEFEHAYDY